VRSYGLFAAKVSGRCGLEIGGPSSVFSDGGLLPLYRAVQSLDNCVFAEQTHWGERQIAGHTFIYHPKKRPGANIIRDATSLSGMRDASYEFILASHVIEHIANPIKALVEWGRVLGAHGAVVAILPFYRSTFDHWRTPTTIEHMEMDYRNDTSENDLSHLEEILALHDLSRSPEVGSAQKFRERSLRNFENRCLHHHVFDEHNSRGLFERAGFFIHTVELVKPHHLVLLATKATGHV
jgi:SAM-dependent methyltransferase